MQRSGLDQLREARIVLTWQLSDFVWSPSLLAIERIRDTQRRERERVTERVLALYFTWVRALSEDPSDPEAAWIERQSRARLDAETGGWFLQYLDCAAGSLMTP